MITTYYDYVSPPKQRWMLEEVPRNHNTLSEENPALSQADADSAYSKLESKVIQDQNVLDAQTEANAKAVQGVATGPVADPDRELTKPDHRHSPFEKKPA